MAPNLPLNWLRQCVFRHVWGVRGTTGLKLRSVAGFIKVDLIGEKRLMCAACIKMYVRAQSISAVNKYWPQRQATNFSSWV
jgi:hypothetical protein